MNDPGHAPEPPAGHRHCHVDPTDVYSVTNYGGGRLALAVHTPEGALSVTTSADAIMSLLAEVGAISEATLALYRVACTLPLSVLVARSDLAEAMLSAVPEPELELESEELEVEPEPEPAPKPKAAELAGVRVGQLRRRKDHGYVYRVDGINGPMVTVSTDGLLPDRRVAGIVTLQSVVADELVQEAGD